MTVEIAFEDSLHDNFNFKKAPATSWRSSFKFRIATERRLHDNFKIEKASARRFFDNFKFKKAIETLLHDSFKIEKAHAPRFLPFFKIEKAHARRFLPFFKIFSPVKLNIYAISTLKWLKKQDSGLFLILKRGYFLVATAFLNLQRGKFLKLTVKSILKNVTHQDLCPFLKLFLSWNGINIQSH